MSVRNRNIVSRVVRALSGGSVVLGAATAGALSFRLPGVSELQALLTAGLLPVAAVIGLALHSRALNREKWEAAWNAYAEQDQQARSLGSLERQKEYFLAELL